MTPYIAASCVIPKSELTYLQQSAIRRELTYSRKTADGDEEFRLYEEYEDTFKIPRAYGAARFGLDKFEDKMSRGSRADFEFLGKLDNKKRGQHKIVKDIKRSVGSGRGGIVQAVCGQGKTVMGLYAASKWKKTTAVYVHTEFLADQWEQTALDLFTLKPEDIGRVQQDRCDFEGKKLVLAITPSVAKSTKRNSARTYPEEWFNWAGVTLFDECHRYGAAMWSRVMHKANSGIRVGLSATPERNDGMTCVILNHLGPIVSYNSIYQENPIVQRVHIKLNIPHRAICNWGRGKPLESVNMARMINQLAKNTKRNRLLCDFVAGALEDGRKVIVLTDRLTQIDDMENILRSMLGSNFCAGRYIGGLTQEQRDHAASFDLVFATNQLAAEGLNIPTLDTLVMGTPRASVEQMAGRILRTNPDKCVPVVIDPVDDLPTTDLPRKLASTRSKLYLSKGWKVQNVYEEL